MPAWYPSYCGWQDVPSLEEHQGRTHDLMRAFAERENRRVPIRFACDEQVWTRIAGCSFNTFYHDATWHLRAQLDGWHWFRHHVIGDQAMGLPDRWLVVVQHWMEENAYVGCEITYQEDDYAWGQPLDLPKQELLAHIRDLDPEERVRATETYRLYQEMRDLTTDLAFCDRPVQVYPPGRGTHGIFTKAAEVRGIDRLCMDLVEDPEFARQYLDAFAEAEIARTKAWRRLAPFPDEEPLPNISGFGFADDSLQLVSAATARRFLLGPYERLYGAMTTGRRSFHVCGLAMQHYPMLVEDLGITTIDGPGDFCDHASYLARYLDLGFHAQTDSGILLHGSREDIVAMMRKLLAPGAKQPGRYWIDGFLTRHMPVETLRTVYDLGLEMGTIPDAAS